MLFRILIGNFETQLERVCEIEKREEEGKGAMEEGREGERQREREKERQRERR